METDRPASTRRRVLAAGAALGTSALAGCTGLLGDGGAREVTLEDFRGSGPLVASRPEPEGTRMADLPDLSGTLTLYVGGGEGGLYMQLVELLKELYPDFDVRPKIQPTSQLANTIVTEMEAGQSPADVFLAVDAGSLGVVADAGATVSLPAEVLEPVPDHFQDSGKQWVGVAGRARAIPYNTTTFSEADIPTDVMAFGEDPRFQDRLGWAPTYGAFQAFVTAMRLLRGRRRTKRWLQDMLDQGVTEYANEFLASNAVADGEVAAAFANHYYALRVQSARSGAPIALAFTRNDAGSLVNVSGAEVVKGTDQEDLAVNFVRHLLSAEAQEFFATRTFAYPMIPGVAPVGDLPRVDDLRPPDLDLEKLSDVKPTIDLLREVGVIS